MIYPAVMFLEMALDSLKDMRPEDVEHHLREFRMLGTRLEQAGMNDVEHAYLLGLQTARVLLMTMPAAVQAGIEL